MKGSGFRKSSKIFCEKSINNFPFRPENKKVLFQIIFARKSKIIIVLDKIVNILDKSVNRLIFHIVF